jgi:hypothetical protein
MCAATALIIMVVWTKSALPVLSQTASPTATPKLLLAALQVESRGIYYHGVANAELPERILRICVLHTQPTTNLHLFEVSLGVEKISVKTYKDFVSVLIQRAEHNFL